MSLLVRRATADDWRQLRDVRLSALAAAPTAFASTLEREQGFSDDTWRGRIEANLVFLALIGDEIVGTATGFDDPATAPGCVSLVAMYVEPVARGTGCAHRLIDAVADAATASGASRLVLHVTDVNPVAERCYRRYGFTPSGRQQPLPHRPEIAEIEMVLDLGRSRRAAGRRGRATPSTGLRSPPGIDGRRS